MTFDDMSKEELIKIIALIDHNKNGLYEQGISLGITVIDKDTGDFISSCIGNVDDWFYMQFINFASVYDRTDGEHGCSIEDFAERIKNAFIDFYHNDYNMKDIE